MRHAAQHDGRSPFEPEGPAENTPVLFASDNGGADCIGLPEVNAPFRGKKRTLFGGGIHVTDWPSTLAAPVNLDKGGSVDDAPEDEFIDWAKSRLVASSPRPHSARGLRIVYRVFGSRISYFTGKLETYLRYRGHAYELLPTYAHAREVAKGTGSTQMPAMQLPDGRWTSDSTPILSWLDAQDTQAGKPSIYPAAPAIRFVALLLEDYADEWLWRPAMHYRWSYALDRSFASRLLAEEQMPGNWPPPFLRRRAIVRRQLGGFVNGDGVTAETWDHVEAGYFKALACLEDIFAKRPFVFGDRPSIADFGLMGPMLRHFGQDPTPADLMRERAPGVFEWVARMWNLGGRKRSGSADASAGFVDQPDDPVANLVREACETHLVQLRENAKAVAAKHERYAQKIQGVRYEAIPAGRYRVWCLEKLRQEWAALDSAAQSQLRPWLDFEGGDVLWDETTPLGSGHDERNEAPFNRALNVFDKDVRA